MKIVVIDDYENAIRTRKCYPRLKDLDVVVFKDTDQGPTRVAEGLKDAEVVLLTRQRSRFPRQVIDRLSKLRFMSQTGGNTSHFDVAACTGQGIIISARGGGRPHTT